MPPKGTSSPRLPQELARLAAVSTADRRQAVVDSFGNAMLAAAVPCFIGTAVAWLRGRG